MSEQRDLIIKLGQKITDRIGVKVTVDDPEYWGLAGVVTDEMAEVALSMKVRVPATAEEIAGRCGKDLAVLENVGNLVCPAEFDTGAVKNVTILSVPEGHDKPLKYPLIYNVCDALIINKIDVLPYFDFDMEKVREYAHMRNPGLEIFPVSAKTGEGMDAWCSWLLDNVKRWNA